MNGYVQKRSTSLPYRILSAFIAIIFIFSVISPPPQLYAQSAPSTVLNLPIPGTMVTPTDAYMPALVKGLTIHPDNPLEFDFIIDTGNSGLAIEGEKFRKESMKMIKYFLASLTIPEEELWVNLSPYEKDRIIPEGLSQTDMGRDMLAQDYMLKQLTASLIYPEDELGQKFWNRVYTKAQEMYGTTEIPMNTFNKIWIIPKKAVVYEKNGTVFVVEKHLKVMLEEDYLALQNNLGIEKFGLDSVTKSDAEVISGISSGVVRDVLIPEIEHEVNQGKIFAPLRQVYNSMILSAWYKKNLSKSLLGQLYMDKNKIKGVDVEDKDITNKIYNQYVEAFKKGVYDYIREDYDSATQQMIPRKYFSGGEKFLIDGIIQEMTDAEFGASPLARRAASAVVGKSAKITVETLGIGEKVDLGYAKKRIKASTVPDIAVSPTDIVNKPKTTGIDSNQELMQALREGMVVEAEGDGSRVIVNLTPKVKSAMRNIFTVVNPDMPLVEGELDTVDVVKIQEQLRQNFGFQMMLAEDGQSLSFGTDLSAEEAQDAVSSSLTNISTKLLYVAGVFMAALAGFNLAQGNLTSGTIWIGASMLNFVNAFLRHKSESQDREKDTIELEFIKYNARVETAPDGQEGSVVTLPRPKERPIGDKEWTDMMDSLAKAVNQLQPDEYAIKKGADVFVITTNVVKGNVEEKIADMVSSPTVAVSKPKTTGGIDLNPDLLDLQIKRDGNGVPLPVWDQPIESMKIEGFIPIILNVTPVSIPMLLGLADVLPAACPANEDGSSDCADSIGNADDKIGRRPLRGRAGDAVNQI